MRAYVLFDAFNSLDGWTTDAPLPKLPGVVAAQADLAALEQNQDELLAQQSEIASSCPADERAGRPRRDTGPFEDVSLAVGRRAFGEPISRPVTRRSARGPAPSPSPADRRGRCAARLPHSRATSAPPAVNAIARSRAGHTNPRSRKTESAAASGVS